jgi:hypothetical protein
MKHWEIVADNLSKAGWNWGCVSRLQRRGQGGPILKPESSNGFTGI